MLSGYRLFEPQACGHAYWQAGLRGYSQNQGVTERAYAIVGIVAALHERRRH